MPEIALPPFLTHCLGIVLILHTCLIAVVAYAAVANLSKGDQKRFIRRVPFSCDAYVRGFSAFFLSALPPPVLSRSVAGLCRCGHVVSEPQRAALPPPVLSRSVAGLCRCGHVVSEPQRAALPPPVLSRSVAGLCRCGHVVSEPQRAAPLPPSSPPSSPAAWERKGARGKVRAARRAPQHRR